MGRPRKQEIELTGTERASLSDLVRSRSAPQGLVRRARIVLASAVGASKTAIAREVGLSIPAVGHWRKRFLEQGLAGLYGEQRPGRPRDHDDEAVARLLATSCEPPQRRHALDPTRRGAEATEIPEYRVRAVAAVRVHRHLLLKTLQALERPAVGREGPGASSGFTSTRQIDAVVLCVDAESQSQRRADPAGSADGVRLRDGITHDYKRHGTTALCSPPWTSPTGRCWHSARRGIAIRSSWRSSKRIDAAVPARLDVHLVIDNYATHKHPKVRALAHRAGALPCPLHADLQRRG